MEQYKVCPRCKTSAALTAEKCTNCGRVYKTKFEPPTEKTQVFTPPQDPVLKPQVPNQTAAPRKNPNRGITIFFVTLAVICLPLSCVFIAAEFNPSPTHGTHHPKTAIEMRNMIQQEHMGEEEIIKAFGKSSTIQSTANAFSQNSEIWYYKFPEGRVVQIELEYGRVSALNVY